MNEFEKLEAELKELRPVAPSKEFTARLENALGDAGNVAMCCMPEEESSSEDPVGRTISNQTSHTISFPRLAAFIGLGSLGLAAVWAMIFYLSTSLVPSDLADDVPKEGSMLVKSDGLISPSLLTDDPDSPLHGLSLDQIQDVSVMPVSGWSDPQINERFLRMVDEGVFQQPGGLPARRLRHYFMDETLWSHPASDTRILSTTPREEVILIELETY